MILQDSVHAIEDAHFGPGFVRPLYDSYCFSQIPALVQSLFADDDRALQERLLGPQGGQFTTVVLLLVDGFGWRFFQEYADRYPFLQRFERDGVVTQLTSQFPSTTAAHITTMHTGLTPAESGVYEWYVYEPSLDTVIETLPFQRIGRRRPGSLLQEGVRPESIFPTRTLHQALSSVGVSSDIFQSATFTPSPFGDVVMDGARQHPYGNLEAGVRELAEALAAGRGGYYYLYAGEIDAAGHKSGPSSNDFARQIDRCFATLERALSGLSPGAGRTLLMMTADHGQVSVDPAETLYLNRSFPDVEQWVRRSTNGNPMLPSGNGRDMVLYTQPERLEEAQQRLAEHLAGIAEVWLVRDMIEEGFFGSRAPSDAFLRRIGDLMVLPYRDRLIWWDAPNYRLAPFLGQHGGLSAAEMETELLSLEL